MFPGFVTIYRDLNKFVHIYFFPGLNNNDKYYYCPLDMNKCGYKFDVIKHDDKSLEFIFKDKTIYGVECKLVKYSNKNNYNKEIIKLNE